MASELRAPDFDATTDKILSSALRCFGEEGFRSTSLSRVAVEAGVSRPTLYARYPDKTALFRAVIGREFQVALEEVSRTIDELDVPFAERVEAVLIAYFGTLFDRFHDLPRIDELVLVQSEEAEDIIESSREALRRRLTRMIKKEVDQETIDLRRSSIPISQLVDLMRLAPLSLKTGDSTSRSYRGRLRALARLIASAVEKGPRALSQGR